MKPLAHSIYLCHQTQSAYTKMLRLPTIYREKLHVVNTSFLKIICDKLTTLASSILILTQFNFRSESALYRTKEKPPFFSVTATIHIHFTKTKSKVQMKQSF